MENLKQIKSDIAALLKIDDYEFTKISFEKDRLVVSIAARINGKLRILRQSEKNIMNVATALQNEYDTLLTAKTQTEQFKTITK